MKCDWALVDCVHEIEPLLMCKLSLVQQPVLPAMDALNLLKDDDENVNRADKSREIDLSVSEIRCDIIKWILLIVLNTIQNLNRTIPS